MIKRIGWLWAFGALLMIGACGSDESKPEADNDTKSDKPIKPQVAPLAKTTGDNGLILFGSKARDAANGDSPGSTGPGVNSYLWHASLDTIHFMPLTSADPFGGVIITDWYSPPASPTERFKITVYVLDRQLRANALRVSVFRQTKEASSPEWTPAVANSKAATDLENAILVRARELRLDTAAASK